MPVFHLQATHTREFTHVGCDDDQSACQAATRDQCIVSPDRLPF